ncbi:MAG: hypothetical protein K0S53_2516 [Bacteroidetes bacterium]|jgi:hypothetical protein|nr:hypothetical protein [Bacteroidota bacterium]MDF2453874.1 hypothetical protein [Bacteroidota bacterium]
MMFLCKILECKAKLNLVKLKPESLQKRSTLFFKKDVNRI